MDNPVIILGANGLGACVLDILQENEVVVYGFLDDDKARHGQEIHHIPILGKTTDDGYLKLIGRKCEAFIAHDDNVVHKDLVEMLLKRRKKMPINAIHPQAYIASTASLGHGNLLQANTVINSQAQLGNHCIINTGTMIDYEASVGDFVQIGAGSIINAQVTIEEGAFIGTGATIVAGVRIGKNARIGAGSVVIQHVEEESTMFGNPAKEV